MIFIFDRTSKEVVGMATEVFDNGSWREATLEELYPDRDRSNLGCVTVRDSPKYALNPEGWQLKLDENGEPVGIERKPSLPRIHLTTNAPDTDGDGLPELPADGQSKATIAIEVRDVHGKLIEEERTLNLKTTGGALSARRITTSNGQATVDLTSSLETVSVTIEVAAEGVRSASLSFEFMPPGQ
jgi:hypothetical protein